MIKNKRGQIAIFVIVAILIIIALSLVIYFKYPKGKQYKSETKPSDIKSYTDSCLDFSSNKAILEIGEKSGYYESPLLSTAEGIAYYYNDKENLMPNLSFIQNEINKSFNDKFSTCLNNFSNFSLRIESEKPKTKVNISEGEVRFDVSFLIKIYKGNSTTRINYSESKIVRVKLKEIYSIATKIVNERISNDYVYLTDFFELPKVEGLNITLVSEEGIDIFNITDINSRINNERFSFLFAGRI